MDKYEINFSEETKDLALKRLINQLWKLIPMRENGEDWESHLKIMIEEIAGIVKIYKTNPDGLVLLSKLEGLDSNVCEDFFLFRKSVFRCIDLLAQVIKDE